jgi:hypothetical protein
MTDDENFANRPPQTTSAPAMSENVRQCPIAADDARDLPLSDSHHAAINLLLLAKPLNEVAAAAGVSVRTLHRWRTAHPAFRAELQRRRDDLLARTADRFRTLLDASLDALDRQVHDHYAPTAHRAARTLLTLAKIGNYLAPQPHDPTRRANEPAVPIQEDDHVTS